MNKKLEEDYILFGNKPKRYDSKWSRARPPYCPGAYFVHFLSDEYTTTASYEKYKSILANTHITKDKKTTICGINIDKMKKLFYASDDWNGNPCIRCGTRGLVGSSKIED